MRPQTAAGYHMEQQQPGWPRAAQLPAYTRPGSNWRPSARWADAMATRPRVPIIQSATLGMRAQACCKDLPSAPRRGRPPLHAQALAAATGAVLAWVPEPRPRQQLPTVPKPVCRLCATNRSWRGGWWMLVTHVLEESSLLRPPRRWLLSGDGCAQAGNSLLRRTQQEKRPCDRRPLHDTTRDSDIQAGRGQLTCQHTPGQDRTGDLQRVGLTS